MAPPTALSEGITAQSDLDDTDDSSPSFLDTSTDMARLKPREMLLLSSRATLETRSVSLSGGGVAGVVVGVIVAVFLALVCAYPFFARRRRTKKHGPPQRLDTETAFVPGPMGPSGQAPAPGPGVNSHLSSKDSLGHKTDTLRGTEKQPTKDKALYSHNGVDRPPSDELASHYQRGFTSDSTQPSTTTRRGTTEYSFGRAPTWKSEASYPWTPAGVELVATRADGMDYADANHGHSATYYSPTIPSEAFGMVTPPAGEPQTISPPSRRSSSQGSSLKLNLANIMRRISTKDSVLTRTKGPPAQPSQPVLSEVLSDSPTELTGASFRERGPGAVSTRQLDSPIHLPVSPMSESEELDHAQELDAKRATKRIESPPILPPVVPAPGTVNPMDIMAPSNPTEHHWHTNQQLYQMANSPSRPAPTITKPAPNSPQPSQAPTPQSPPEELFEQEQHQQNFNEASKVDENGHTQVNGWNSTDGSNANGITQDVQMSDGAHHADSTHLLPDHSQHYLDGDMTDPSEHSPPMLGHASSGPSYQSTPNTQIDSSPSPRSDGSSDIRNSTSPYPGLQPSPRTFICDECGRFFDQVHKLNHHKRYHERPHECSHPNCGKRFGTKTHLDRHINDKHRKTKKFHCTVSTCPYSKAGGKSFPRKDNWRRHMMNIHQVTPVCDPEPDIVDEAMGGT
ncbi:zinc finger protein 2 [Colletotrichum graminicola]|nr:zinc finger protein 2 [Colletotrichum graminicola]